MTSQHCYSLIWPLGFLLLIPPTHGRHGMYPSVTKREDIFGGPKRGRALHWPKGKVEDMEMKEDSAAADREDRDQAMPSEWAFIRSKLDDRNYLLVMVMAMVLCLVPRTSRHAGVRAMRSARGEKKVVILFL